MGQPRRHGLGRKCRTRPHSAAPALEPSPGHLSSALRARSSQRSPHPGHTPSPASKLQASLQNNASADQTPATPPVQPRAPSDHGQAQPTAAVGSRVNASGPPSWAEEGSMGGAQRAAANWAAPGAAPEPARPVPATPAPVLPRLQPPPAEASKPPRKDSTQRKKVHCKQKIVATSQFDQPVLS